MKYKTLTQLEKDKMIVAFLKGQETDLYLAEINKDRYEKMLANEKLDKEFRKKIEGLLASTIASIQNVEIILEASKEQIPSDDRIEKALKSLK